MIHVMIEEIHRRIAPLGSIYIIDDETGSPERGNYVVEWFKADGSTDGAIQAKKHIRMWDRSRPLEELVTCALNRLFPGEQ